MTSITASFMVCLVVDEGVIDCQKKRGNPTELLADPLFYDRTYIHTRGQS